MSFQTTAQTVLTKARRIDAIAEELQVLFADLGELDRELWTALQAEGGVGARPGAYVDWVGLEGSAKREINEAVHGGQGWERLPTLEQILLNAWGSLLVDQQAQNTVEGN